MAHLGHELKSPLHHIEKFFLQSKIIRACFIQNRTMPLEYSLYFMFYNFCKIHKTLRVTPGMEAKLTDRVWSANDIVTLIPEEEPKKRGHYKKRISE